MLNEIPGYAAVMLWMQKIYDRGCSAFYNHVDEKTGFKWYRRQDEALHTHTMQSFAAEQGWGPQVGKLVKVGPHYGYLTERVITLGDLVYKGEKPAWGNCDTLYMYFKRIGMIDIPAMSKQFKMTFSDMHSSNVGFMLHDYNKGVILDFGCVRYDRESKLRPFYDERYKETEKSMVELVASA